MNYETKYFSAFLGKNDIIKSYSSSN